MSSQRYDQGDLDTRVSRRGPRKGKTKTTTRRMRISDLQKCIGTHYQVPSSSGNVTDVKGEEVYMGDPMGTAVTYLRDREGVASKQDVLKVEVDGKPRDRSYIEVPFAGTTVRFQRR